jgi:hypothetical protein
MNSKILTVSGQPHPKVEITEVNAETGVAIFAWLDAAGNRVDSGGSGARFTPTFTEVDGKQVPVAPTDAILIAAIENPPEQPASVVVLTPLTILSRMTQAEEAALSGSTDLAVSIVRNRLIAASEVRSDDPRTDEGKAILIAKGVITAERASEIFA